MFDKGNLHWKLLTDDEVLMLMLWYRGMPESWSHAYGTLEKAKRLQHRCYLVRKQLDESMITNTMLFQPRFCFSYFEKLHLYALFFFYNTVIGAKHTATETFLHCLLNKPFSKINFFFFLLSQYLIVEHFRSNNLSCYVCERWLYLFCVSIPLS